MHRIAIGCVAAAAAMSCAPSGWALGQGYSLVGSFRIPDGVGARTVTGDGRVLALVGNELRLQSGVGSSSFERVGSMNSALINSFGASCLAISPDGATIAIGDGNFGPGASVHFVEWSALDPNADSSVVSVEAASYEAHWASDGRLYLSGGDFSSSFVSVVEGFDTPALSVRRIIDGVGGASAGVTVHEGFVYTANGFDYDDGSGSGTGDVRAFAIDAITAGASPADFEADGVLVASALSGNTLAFDGLGNLAIGGGDFLNPEQFGFASIVDGAAVEAALAGLGAANDADEQWISPAGSNAYGTIYNAFTDELLVWGYGDGVMYRYAIPAPGAAPALAGGLLLAGRRRRRG